MFVADLVLLLPGLSWVLLLLLSLDKALLLEAFSSHLDPSALLTFALFFSIWLVELDASSATLKCSKTGVAR